MRAKSLAFNRNRIIKLVRVCFSIVTRGFTTFGGRSDRDGREIAGSAALISSLNPSAGAALWLSIFSAASASVIIAFEDPSEVRLRRLPMDDITPSSASTDEVLRFRSNLDPSIGSSSTIKLLKTECESGLIAPLWEGSKSRASFGAEDRRRVITDGVSWFTVSGSRALDTHPGQRHFAASRIVS